MADENRVILKITSQMLEETGESQTSFVLENLAPALVKGGLKEEMVANDVDEFLRIRAKYKQHISRIFTGSSEIPLSWKWIWIACLPSPYRERCITELQALIPSILPSENGQPQIADIGRLSTEFGEAITATAPIAADGRYDKNDDPELVKAALNELYDLRDQAQAQIDRIERGTGQRVNRTPKRTVTVEQRVTIHEH